VTTAERADSEGVKAGVEYKIYRPVGQKIKLNLFNRNSDDVRVVLEFSPRMTGTNKLINIYIPSQAVYRDGDVEFDVGFDVNGVELRSVTPGKLNSFSVTTNENGSPQKVYVYEFESRVP
jgi:hypothetical protein